jgi:hypothetical protein
LAGLIAVQRERSSSQPIDLWRSVAGGAWQRLGEPCGGHLGLMAATSPSELVMLCGGSGHPRVTISTDGGSHIKQFAASSEVPFPTSQAPRSRTSRSETKRCSLARPMKVKSSCVGCRVVGSFGWA